jgi:V8-like Glu-specific endopeptidase
MSFSRPRKRAQFCVVLSGVLAVNFSALGQATVSTAERSLIDLRGKSDTEIATLRDTLQKHGSVKAEINSGINGDKPDLLLFSPNPNVNSTIDLPGVFEVTSPRKNSDMLERFIPASDADLLAKKTVLPIKKPMTDDCAKAIATAYSNGVTGGNDAETDRQAGKGANKLVETTCMATLVSTSSSQLDERTPEWAKAEPIASLVGVLFIDTGSQWTPFCTGLLYSSGTILTAKHCFFDPNNGAPRIDKIKLMELGLVYFGVAAANSKAQRLSGISQKVLTDHVQFTYARDLVLVDLSEHITGEVPAIVFRDPVPGEELLIAGVADKALTTEQTPSANKVLRYTANADCQAMVVAGSCLRHDCQTETSFSGAPVFATPSTGEVQSHSVRVAAFHLGATSQDACREASIATPGIAEVGNEGMLASTAQSLLAEWSSHQ